MKQIAIFRELLSKLIGRLLGEFRGWRTHDRQRAIAGKCLIKRKLTVVPGKVRRNQRFNIRVDREPRDVIGRGAKREQHSDDDGRPSMAGAKFHDAHDCRIAA
jgi:hypothetical protein